MVGAMIRKCLKYLLWWGLVHKTATSCATQNIYIYIYKGILKNIHSNNPTKYLCKVHQNLTNTTYSRCLIMLMHFIPWGSNCVPRSIGWEALNFQTTYASVSPQLFSQRVEWYIFWKVARKGRDLSSQIPFLHLKDARKGLSKTLWAVSSFTRQNKSW